MESKNLKNRLIRVITADNFNSKTCTFHTIRLNGGNENNKSKTLLVDHNSKKKNRSKNVK